MSVQTARNLADQIIRENSIIEPAVDVRTLAEKHGLRVVFQDLDAGISGLLVTNSGQSYCFVNNGDALVRQRFTIGHELGHFLLKHQEQLGEHVHVDRGNFISMRSPRSAQGIDLYEIEANQFSAHLLMPEVLVKNTVEKFSFDGAIIPDDKVVLLAETFQVSEQAMTIRLANLGYL